MKYKRIMIGLMIFVLLAGGSVFFWKPTTLTIPQNLVFTTITGEKITIKGAVFLVNFWATDCASCIKEIPDLKHLYKKYHSQGLEIIGISIYYDLPNHVVAMTKAKQIPYPISLDLKRKYAKIFGDIELTPSTLLINSNGEVIFKKIGLFDLKNLEKVIEKSLNR